MKAEFLQLAQKYDPKSSFVSNWFYSEKLDGERMLWDGGISRGMLKSEVPWANTSKDARFKIPQVSTGCWSRYGNVIHVSNDILDSLPAIPLDCELFLGHKRWQELTSIIKRHDPDSRWEQVRLMVLDSPPLQTVFADKLINNTNYKKRFSDIISWIQGRYGDKFFIDPKTPYEFVYSRLKKSNIENKYVKIHEQKVVPLHKTHEFIEAELERVVDQGVEGLIIRNPGVSYKCERTHDLLKYKPYNDDEGIVVGYTWGEETDLGSKLLGLMGSLRVLYKNIQFDLSGFTNQEREMEFVRTHVDAYEEGRSHPGESVDMNIHNPRFPCGSRITFRYRELSDSGVPKEAKYLRKFEAL